MYPDEVVLTFPANFPLFIFSIKLSAFQPPQQYGIFVTLWFFPSARFRSQLGCVTFDLSAVTDLSEFLLLLKIHDNPSYLSILFFIFVVVISL